MANRAKLTAALEKAGLKTRLVRTEKDKIFWAIHFPKTDNILEATLDDSGISFAGNGTTPRDFPEDLYDSPTEWSMAVLSYFWDRIQILTELRIDATLKAVHHGK